MDIDYYNESFVFVKGRPVAYVDQVDTAELDRCGFRRIVGAFNAEAQGFDKPTRSKPLLIVNNSQHNQPKSKGPVH